MNSLTASALYDYLHSKFQPIYQSLDDEKKTEFDGFIASAAEKLAENIAQCITKEVQKISCALSGSGV